jgi:CTD nuclear envelope phosphatase 1
MNSLSFLSKQLDASASRSASQSRLYASEAESTDTERSRSGSPTTRSSPNLHGDYKRSRTWSKPLFFRQRAKKPLFVLDDSTDSDDDSNASQQHSAATISKQRSFSSPEMLNKGSSSYPLSRLKPPTAVVEVVESSQQLVKESCLSRRFRRLQLVRALSSIWDALCIVCEQIILVPLVAPEPSGKLIQAKRRGREGKEPDSDTSTTADSDDEPLTVNPVTRAPPGKFIEPPTLEIIAPSSRPSYSILDSRGPGPLMSTSAPPFSQFLTITDSTQLPPHPPPSPPRRSLFDLPKILVLDLDETLIHSTSRSMHRYNHSGGLFGFEFGGKRNPPGHTIEVVLNGRRTLYHVYKRPFVDYFLRKVCLKPRAGIHMLTCFALSQVSSWYTLVIFTASMQEYADPVIDWLDAGRGLLKRRLFRDVRSSLLRHEASS